MYVCVCVCSQLTVIHSEAVTYGFEFAMRMVNIHIKESNFLNCECLAESYECCQISYRLLNTFRMILF